MELCKIRGTTQRLVSAVRAFELDCTRLTSQMPTSGPPDY
jgi:hypothetical protein